MGQDWRPKTFRELLVQWEAKLLSDWSHTASIRGCFAKKNAAYHDLHPYWRKGESSGSPQAIKLKPQKLFSSETHNSVGERISIMSEMKQRESGNA